MKNRLITNTLRTIKKSLGRFFSLIIMSLLGVIVFVGLLATSPDMYNTLDTYLDKYNTYDIKVISTMGLTDNDLLKLEQIDSIDSIQGTFSLDVLIESDTVETVINVSSLPKDINTLELIEGRLPDNEKEIVVEENFLKKLSYNLGDKIVLDNENLKNNEYTIVGSIRSSLYFSNTKINQNRGATTVGSGIINYYTYIMADNFEQDYYTNVYMTVKDSKKLVTGKDKYDKRIEEVLNEIRSIKKDLEEERYQNIYSDAKKEIEDKEKESLDELNKAKNKLDDAKSKLDSAKRTLDNSKRELDKAKTQLTYAKKELDNGKKTFNDTLKQYGITDINDSLNIVNENIAMINNQLSMLSPEMEEYQVLYGQLEALYGNKVMLEELNNNRVLLDNSQKEYEKGYREYNNGYSEYQKGLNTYNSNLKTYNNGYNEYLNNKEKAEKEFKDAYEKLNDINRPKLYIYDRSDDQTYASYINQADSIKNLASLFPLVFYGVAVLVSLVSMNRMVEDDRGEIGTLKSLGFSNRHIRSKYIIFSLTATLIGSAIGAVIGLTAIPYLILTIYKLLFDVPIFVFGLNIVCTLEGVLIAILCTCGASIITSNKILKDKPAVLMRPEAPKSGKKILLERVKFIWNRLNFSNKITIRNLLRYKKRISVTIFGICGCTALMLCGFGIKDSIVDITNMQYVKTFIYEISVYTNDLDREEVPELIEDLPIIDTNFAEIITGTYKDSSVSMIVLDDSDKLKNIAYIEDRDGKVEELDADDVIVTDKLADLYQLHLGDKISLLDSEQNEYTMEITKIVKNYLGHYIYINKDTLENMGYEYKDNVIYMNTLELCEEEKDEISNKLLENDNVISVVHMSTLVNSAQDMLDSLDKVIVVLVSLSACLSFVVLYNLSNINIRERKREIATLKVLGFYDKEVDAYITREMVILTVLGIGFGLGFGYLLTNMVISTVEMENARFIRHIKLNSYIYSTVISIIFTFIVNFVTHFALKRIDMIESLKSVE